MLTYLKLLLIGVAVALSPAGSATPTLLVMGDSLSASYGIQPQQGWVNLLQQRLRRQGYPHRIVNASISGETSSGGAARIDRLLARESPAVVIIALGANDGLRGLSLKAMRRNLARMIKAARAAGAQVLLAGVQLPPNYGPAYNRLFEATFRELAQHHQIALMPSLLADIGGRRELFQKDGLHPGVEAQAIIESNVWRHLAPLLSPR